MERPNLPDILKDLPAFASRIIEELKSLAELEELTPAHTADSRPKFYKKTEATSPLEAEALLTSIDAVNQACLIVPIIEKLPSRLDNELQDCRDRIWALETAVLKCLRNKDYPM